MNFDFPLLNTFFIRIQQVSKALSVCLNDTPVVKEVLVFVLFQTFIYKD